MIAPAILHGLLDELMNIMGQENKSHEVSALVVNGIPVAIMSLQLVMDPVMLAHAYGTELPPISELPRISKDIDEEMRNLKPRDVEDLDKP